MNEARLVGDTMELLYHYLWKNRLFGLSPKLTSGENIMILDPGRPNSDAGPDFFNSKIKLNGTEWIGNIEIHVRASDWYRHNHHNDPAYDSVILHVVGKSDREVSRTDGSVIPQMELALPKEVFLTYSELAADLKRVRCSSRLKDLSKLVIRDWMDSLGIERLQSKSSRILDLVRANDGDWNRTAFITLARGLGFGLNAEPFERLACSIPLNYLLRHSDNRLQLEALLLGQANLIPEKEGPDEYCEKLRREYRFLAQKYNLTPIQSGSWRFAKTRPQNFPHRRVAFLATALSGAFRLPGLLKENAGNTDSLRKVFESWELDGYWACHYNFGIPTPEKIVNLSRSSVDLLLINVAAPFLYGTASSSGDPELGEKAVDVWNSLPAERNSIITEWEKNGLPAENAFESQSLIQLRREYCDKSDCLKCRFGANLLRSKVRPGPAPRPRVPES